MKLKEYFYMLGLIPKSKTYGYKIKQLDLSSFGKIHYAQWEHPKVKDIVITEKNILRLKEFIKPGDFCIDIGPHSGDTTVPMAIAAQKSGLVLAIEPNSYVFPTLNKNSFLNVEKTNIIPLMVAATEEYGDMTFEYSDSGFCNGGRHKNVSKWKHGHAFNLKVSGVNLADVLENKFQERLEKLKYIKIDAEGYDYYIIKSIEGIIDKYRPYIKAEVWKHTDQSYRNNIYNFFHQKGYTISRTFDDDDYTGIKIEKSDMSELKHFDIFCSPN